MSIFPGSINMDSAWDIGPCEYVSGSALLGDVNGDGQVDEEDVQACLRPEQAGTKASLTIPRTKVHPFRGPADSVCPLAWGL